MKPKALKSEKISKDDDKHFNQEAYKPIHLFHKKVITKQQRQYTSTKIIIELLI